MRAAARVKLRSSATMTKAVSYAETKGATPAQIALAWLLAKGPNIVPIPGTRWESHLLENLGARGVPLTAADV